MEAKHEVAATAARRAVCRLRDCCRRAARLGAGLVLAVLLVQPAAAQNMSFNRYSGPSGTKVYATVSGFTPPFNTGIRIQGSLITACPSWLSDNERANCTMEFLVPAIPTGSGGVEVTAFNSTGETATVNFTVTPPWLVVRPSCAAAGLPVRVTGNNFMVGRAVEVIFGTDRTGIFQVVPESGQLDLSFILPPVPDGQYTVTVSNYGYQTASRQIDVARECAPVGRVTDVVGIPRAVAADGTLRALSVGSQVFKGEVIETDSNAAAELLLTDGTSIVVDVSGRLALDEAIYNAATGEGSAFFGFLKGVFVYTSGLIGKNSPDSVNIETAYGSIGIRGTEFISVVNPLAGKELHHLITGKLALTPLDRSLPPEYTGPVTITATATGSSAVPLDAATYAALKASVAPPEAKVAAPEA